LTENELLFIKEKIKNDKYKISENAGRIKKIFPYEIIFNNIVCPFLENNLCTIYNDRFIMCRLYPFDISILPNGEILVDLIHCNGVYYDKGNVVNVEYMTSMMDELEQYNKSFYNSFIKYRRLDAYKTVSGFTFSDNVNPKTKIYIRTFFIELFNHKIIRDIPIELKQPAILKIYYEKFRLIYEDFFDTLGYRSTFLEQPVFLLSIDIKHILNKFKNIFEIEILKYIENSKKTKYDVLNAVKNKKKMRVETGREVLEKNLEDEIDIIFRNKQKKYVKLKDVLIDKKYSKSAILEINKYFIELMGRYGRYGFPIAMPLKIMLESLSQMSWLVYVQSKSYSLPKKIINKKDVIEAISYLDRRNILSNIIIKIYEDYEK